MIKQELPFMNTHGMAAPFSFLHVALFAEVDYDINS